MMSSSCPTQVLADFAGLFGVGFFIFHIFYIIINNNLQYNIKKSSKGSCMCQNNQSKSLPPIQPPPHCPKNCSSVASLHRHRDSLQEEFSAAGLSGGFAEASSEVSREVHCCFPQHSRSLHHKRHEMVARVQMCILGRFRLLRLCSHNTCPSHGS